MKKNADKTIIGRDEEISRLNEYISSDRSEFVAIYGRRRIGKTFLVKELYGDRFTFKITGRENSTLSENLLYFSYALSEYFETEAKPKNWTQAFRLLAKEIEKKDEGTKIIFIDELPWFDTRKSKFTSALELFWNDWAYYRSDIKLLVCGSATSWMLDKIIDARGGLHDRITHSIPLKPFNLNEVEQYYLAKGFAYDRFEILDSYMAIGGVPYYLSIFDKRKSVAGNLDSLCFTKGGELQDEFDRIYRSLFKKSKCHIAIIKALGTGKKGMTKAALLKKTGLSDNGKFSETLHELEACDFIRSFVPFGKKKGAMYQLKDQYTLFYLHFINGRKDFGKGYWSKAVETAEYGSWSGYAFETLCLNHIDQIVSGLGIDGIINTPCSWAYIPKKKDTDIPKGAQIDLVIDRNDKTVNICEMKYSEKEFEIDRSYNDTIEERAAIFKKATGTRKSVRTVFVTPWGLKENAYSGRVQRQVTAKDLFK